MDLIDAVLLALLGLVVGGLLTMVIDRVPDNLPVLRPGPRCPHCEHGLGVGEIVPVVSWVAQRQTCRHCGHRITAAYPAVEVVTAALFVAFGWRYGLQPATFSLLILVSALVALSTVDLYRYRLPDRILFPSLGLAVASIVVVSIVEGVPELIPRALVGAVVYFMLLFVPHLVSPRGMGFGDVKLALLMGLYLGWLFDDTFIGLRLIMYALFLGAVFGVLGGVLLAVVRRVTGRDVLPDPDPEPDEVGLGGPAGDGADPSGGVRTAVAATTVPVLAHSFPFGPALAAGCLIVVLFANDLAR